MYGLNNPARVALAAKGKAAPLFDVKLFNRAVRHVFEKGGFGAEMLDDPQVVDLKNETARCLNDAVDTALIGAEVPEEMASKLRESVFVFSGCKTFHELKEVSQMLLDDTGQVKPLHRFVADVQALHPKYNEQYLEAEYGFAVSSSQMAAKWAEWEQDGDRYDLHYFTAGDSDVRPDHAALNGTTLPQSDPFWLNYMPPNGWNCRCGVKQVLRDRYPRSDSAEAIRNGERATTHLDENNRNRSEMFRFNPGVQKIVFPPNHPYYRNVPEEAKI